MSLGFLTYRLYPLQKITILIMSHIGGKNSTGENLRRQKERARKKEGWETFYSQAKLRKSKIATAATGR